jgi:hypothetical protein
MQHPWPHCSTPSYKPAQSFQVVQRGLRLVALLATTCYWLPVLHVLRKIVTVTYKAGELTVGTCQNILWRLDWYVWAHSIVFQHSTLAPGGVAAHSCHLTGLTFAIMPGPRATRAHIMIIILNMYDTWMPCNLKYITSGYHPQRWYRFMKSV